MAMIAWRVRIGFTMVELLVVVGVITLLATLLFPVFEQAREKGRQMICVNNQHQLALLAVAYAQDHDETLPLLPSFWQDAGAPRKILTCPSAPNTPDIAYIADPAAAGVPLGQILYPALTWLTTDGQYGKSVWRHQGKKVTAYVDTHIAMEDDKPSILAVSTGDARAANTTTARAAFTLAVAANPIWTDTGIDLKPGYTLTIGGAGGSWSWDTSASDLWVGPAGASGVRSNSLWLNSAKFASLIGYIGPVGVSPTYRSQNDPGLFAIGTATISRTFSGPCRLWLGFNDDYSVTPISKNSGAVTVKVTIQR